MSDINSITYSGAVAVTLQASLPGTDPGAPYAALQATTLAGTVTVMMMSGSQVTIYLPLGEIVPVAVRGVQSGGVATGIVGFHANPYKGSAQ